MSELPNCPSCGSEYTYEDRELIVCSLCAHEWNPNQVDDTDHDQITDSNGNPLTDGDDVIVIKDLKVKGSSSSVKKGTKVKSIRLIDDAKDGHDIDCKIDGFGAMKLKSEFVKKA
ncbi:zinc ribbon domain-containing protein YjdM [Amphibacillus indicireducens]|uniref:Zinc ribbon domain-containing protein YjdM n=1 Tax=Amphibacillus indicireducens TaxID=1076330 RepID=A0ABP7VA31_9BACI